MGGQGRPKYPGLLTPREAQVVDRVARGKTNREIAEELGISEQGVKYHLNEVYSKTGLASREELIAWRRERRWIERLLPAWLGVGRAATAASIGGVGLVFVAALVALSGSGEDEPGTVPNDTGDPQSAGYTPVARPTMAAEPNLPPCAVGSVIIPPGTTVTCVGRADEAQAGVAFVLYTPPDWRNPKFVAAAITSGPDGPGAFLRYEVDGQRVDLLEADLPFGAKRLAPGSRISNPSLGWMGFLEFPAEGAIFHWCPLWQMEDGPAADRCARDIQVVVHGMAEPDLTKLVYDIAAERKGMDWRTLGLPAEPTPVPLKVSGKLVRPVTLVPVFPASREIDGYAPPDAGFPIAVQTYETSERLEDVIAWYEQELIAAGWQTQLQMTGFSGRGLRAGRGNYFITVLSSPEPWSRPDGSHPPGFRGAGVPYEHRFNGKWVFWVTTFEKK